jgi:quercetin 2,3-dioxygenase
VIAKSPILGGDSMSAILRVSKLGPPWHARDPYLICSYHNDLYPKANDLLGPNAPLEGHSLGNDFGGEDGWRMYHGDTVPGFPGHPHRGFETVTIALLGLIDHSDSLGASARYGNGDTQWLTAGRGLAHAEMFPLLDKSAPNPHEFFQIWLNLPPDSKLAQPHFTMYWSEDIPRVVLSDEAGGRVEIALIAGQYPGQDSAGLAPPPPDSWASRPAADVAIWTIKLSPGARWTVPKAEGAHTVRDLVFFKGATITIEGQKIRDQSVIELQASLTVEVVNGEEPSELLLLQGRPIGAPVAARGPFVMNTEQQLAEGYAEYRRTQFGGWPWPEGGPTHGGDPARFAKRPDGGTEIPGGPGKKQRPTGVSK